MSQDISRESFLTAILDSSEERRDSVAAQLTNVGYSCQTFSTYLELEASFEKSPPHFLFLSYDDHTLSIEDTLQNIRSTLPETHIFLLCPSTEFTEAMRMYEQGIFDCLSLPLESPVQLVKAVDRAARLNFYYYQNEQLNDRLMILESDKDDEAQAQKTTKRVSLTEEQSDTSIKTWEAPSTTNIEVREELFRRREERDRLPDFRSWLELLYSQPRQDLSIKAFFTGLSQMDSKLKAVFFKYIPQRRTLMAASWNNYEDNFVKSIGLNFNELNPNFRSEDLRDPQSIVLLQELAMMVFKADDFKWYCLSVLGEVQGVFLLVPGHDNLEATVDWELAESYLAALQRHTELLELEKRLHSNSLRDPGTDVLNRHTLLRQISEEVSRARRVKLPTSLVLISLDQYFDIKESLGADDSEAILRALARIFIKHSRVNDVVGRVNSEQFALVLPHTATDGAMIKADRLRKIVESADFSKIVRKVGPLTISLSISEYPSLCRDAEELFQSADEALFQLKTQTSNKITLAKTPKNFEPDFRIMLGPTKAIAKGV